MTPTLPDWFSAAGNFILNYGMLDWDLFAFLEARMPSGQFSEIKNMHFQDRITLVKRFVADGHLSGEKKQAFEKFFGRLGPIRELRNHIAHGHLLVRVEEVGKPPVVTLSLPKNLDAPYAPESRHLEFKELTKALSELAELIEEFKKLSGNWSDWKTIGGNP
jgi:hypothetical protein